jgi:hypothetical protein
VIAQLTSINNCTSLKSSAALACAAYPGFNFYYHNGSGTYPTQNDNIYSDAAGNNPLANGYYAIYYGSATGVTIYVTGGAGLISQNPTTC